MLAVEEEIVELEGRGVAFARCPREVAARILRSELGYHRVLPALGLFPQLKDAAGKSGEELGPVDFADLLALLRLDDDLRDVFGTMALDVERLAKLRLLRRIADDDAEDDRGIVRDYLGGLDGFSRRRVKGNVALRRRRKDEYFHSLALDLEAPLTIVAFLETAVFSDLIDFYLFCSRRWEDKSLGKEHQMLKRVKGVRNAIAHGMGIVYALTPSWRSRYELTMQIRAAYGQSALRREWRQRVQNAVVLDLVTLLWIYGRYADEGYQRAWTRSRLVGLRTRVASIGPSLPYNHAIGYLDFVLASAEVFGLA